MNEITLDINKSGQIINEPVVLRVGEKDQTITVKLLKDGQAYTNFSTATFNANKQNGSIIANDPADISNGVITYSVPQKLVNEFGKITNAYFLIDGKTTTESFVIAVLKGVNLSSDDLNDYIPGMGELDAIYDKWKAKLQKISDELTGIDAPKEVKNVIDNELKNYTDQINELQRKITALKTQLDALEVPEIGGRNLLVGTETLSRSDQNLITEDKFNGNSVIKIPYTTDFPENASFYDAISKPTSISVHKGQYTLSFYAKSDNTGDVLRCFFFSSRVMTTGGITSQNVKSSKADGEVPFSLTTDWKKYWVTWDNDGSSATKTIIVGRTTKKDSNKGAIYITSPIFVEGNVPRDWVPAPEDVQTAITNALGKVDVGKTITATDDTGKTVNLKITGIS